MGPLPVSTSLPPHSLTASLFATAHGASGQRGEGGVGGGGGGGGLTTGFQQEVRKECHEGGLSFSAHIHTHTHTHTHTPVANLEI